MAQHVFIDDDFVQLRTGSQRKGRMALYFGDEVEVLGAEGDRKLVRVFGRGAGPVTGTVHKSTKFRAKGVFRLSMVDVQQGDGAIIQSPEGKIVFIDGGDNKLFARLAAAQFRHRRTSPENPLEIDALVVTHGDADHFDGLNIIRESETEKDLAEHKRLFLHPKRIYHNGLVKAPGKDGERKRKDVEMFGKTAKHGANGLAVVDLYDDPRDSPESMRNQPFTSWCATIDHWEARGPIELRRLAIGDEQHGAFQFLADEEIKVEVQGPLTVRPSAGVTGLEFLRVPKSSSEMHLAEDDTGTFSASHTINGHSIALRITVGNVRFQLTGDLNNEAMRKLRNKLGDDKLLEAEIVKAPHHGSGDFNMEALRAMRPVVSLISSGDESARKEHIHPRANLMSALGRVARGDTGLVFCTELAAFFSVRDYAHTREDLAKLFRKHKSASFTGAQLAKLFSSEKPEGSDPIAKALADPKIRFFALERTNFGIIHVRTDGERVLVFTHSGKEGVNEAYRFTVDENHDIKFAAKPTTRR